MQTSTQVRPAWQLRAQRLARSKSVLVTVAAVVLALLVLALGMGPILRMLAEHEAAQRGFKLKVGRARLGWGAARLENLEVEAPSVPSVRANVSRLDIRLGFDFGLRAIQVHGGTVRLVGSSEEVSRQLEAWRARGGARAGERSRAVDYEVDGINVVWRDLPDKGSIQYVWGFRYARQAGLERIGADRARLSHRRGSVDARSLSLLLTRPSRARLLRSADAGHCEVDVDLHAGDSVGPVAPIQSGPGLAVASIVPVRTGKADAEEKARSWASVRAALGKVPELVRRSVEDSGRVSLANVHLRLRHGSDALNVGPARISVSHARGELVASLEPQAEATEQGAALRMSVRWPLGGGTIGLELRGGPLALAAVGVKEGDFGLRNVREARIELSTTSELSSDLAELGFSGTGRLKNLALEQPKLARGLIRGLSLDWTGEGRVRLDGSEISVSRAELTVGDVYLWGRGSLERHSDYFSIQLEGGIPLASCDAMLASAPEGLLPLLAGVRMSGTFALQGSLGFDTRKPRDMRTRWSVDSGCRIAEVPTPILPDRFKGSFYHDAATATGEPVQIVVGRGTTSWVPLSAISRYMDIAVRLCEDGGFWHHQGFDKGAIKNSLEENLRTGRFVRGASTISMQTAKNLYLKKEKTLSRKLQEVVLTMLLEQELTKEQILELYLNVIEYGPGIYGVGPAAQHYFRSHPGELTLGQALYLASILPRPRVSHFGADKKLSQGWTGYLHRLMRIAHDRKWITEEELAQGLAEPIELGMASGVTQQPIRPSDVAMPFGAGADALEAATPTPEDWDG